MTGAVKVIQNESLYISARIDTPPAATVLQKAAALVLTNSDLSIELALLRAELARLSPHDSPPQSSPAPLPAQTSIIGSGRGASSPSVYESMSARAWTGRLGRTHMAEVDQLSAPALQELDCYLRRTIHKTVAVDCAYVDLNHDNVFAALAVFGLRLEDRGIMADATIFTDTPVRSQRARLQNWGALNLRRGSNYDAYWKGSAMETLVELARYRGLFDDEGWLKM